MKKSKKEPAEYAMYRGDQFIDLGTVTYLAEKYHKKKAPIGAKKKVDTQSGISTEELQNLFKNMD